MEEEEGTGSIGWEEDGWTRENRSRCEQGSKGEEVARVGNTCSPGSGAR